MILSRELFVWNYSMRFETINTYVLISCLFKISIITLIFILNINFVFKMFEIFRFLTQTLIIKLWTKLLSIANWTVSSCPLSRLSIILMNLLNATSWDTVPDDVKEFTTRSFAITSYQHGIWPFREWKKKMGISLYW